MEKGTKATFWSQMAVFEPSEKSNILLILENFGGGGGALPQFVLQTKTHPKTMLIQPLTTHQTPSDCRTPREI